MIRLFVLGFFVFISAGAVFSQDYTFRVSVDNDVVASVAKDQITALISKQSPDNMSLGEPQISYKSGAVEIILDVTRKEKTFFGDITITGQLFSVWTIGLREDDIIVKRGKIQFTNKNKSFSLLDDVISGVAKNFLPEEIPLKKQWIEDELRKAASRADFLDLKFQKVDLTLDHLVTADDHLELVITGSGILASNDIPPLSLTTGALAVSRQWILTMVNLQLKPNNKLEINNVDLTFDDKSWVVESDAVYHFKWLWLIPDVISRKVIVKLNPAAVDSTLHLGLIDVTVYKNEHDEFSFINGYLEGKIADEFKKYEYPLKNIPDKFTTVSGNFQIKGQLEEVSLKSITTVDDRVYMIPGILVSINIGVNKN